MASLSLIALVCSSTASGFTAKPFSRENSLLFFFPPLSSLSPAHLQPRPPPLALLQPPRAPSPPVTSRRKLNAVNQPVTACDWRGAGRRKERRGLHVPAALWAGVSPRYITARPDNTIMYITTVCMCLCVCVCVCAPVRVCYVLNYRVTCRSAPNKGASGAVLQDGGA